MTRALPEWVATHDDQAIPPRVKLRIWERCGGRCAITGKKLMPGDPYEFDHIIALANGGRHAEGNLQLVSSAAHKAKTRTDLATKSKTARVRAKHLGIHPKSRTRIPSRPFQSTRGAR